MGNCCKIYKGEQEEITNIVLQPQGSEFKKEQEANEKFSFEEALDILYIHTNKMLPEKYFNGGKELNNRMFKTEILLNNRLTNSVYKIAQFNKDRKLALRLFNEYLSILTLKQNSCILRSFGLFVDKDKKKIGFLYECLDDNLEHFIFMKYLDLEKRLIIIKKVIETLIHIHSKGIVLLDLSPRNIMFDNNWKMRFTKFENSINRERSYLNLELEITSKTNLAPEILLGTGCFSPNCDIWSLGIMILQLFTGITNYLYYEKGKNLSESQIQELLIENLKNKKPPHILDLIENSQESLPMKAIINGLLRFDPNERPNIFKVTDVFNQYLTTIKKEQYKINYEKTQREEFLRIFNIE